MKLKGCTNEIQTTGNQFTRVGESLVPGIGRSSKIRAVRGHEVMCSLESHRAIREMADLDTKYTVS